MVSSRVVGRTHARSSATGTAARLRLAGVLSLAVVVAQCGGGTQPAQKQAGAAVSVPADGSVLPFPPVPSASVAGATLAESKHQRRAEADHLPKDAPNILIILLDDVGFGLADTYGGPIHTPTLSRIATERHQLQHLSHHGHLLAHAGGAAHRAQPPSGRGRDHRRARGGLGRLHRRDSPVVGDCREGTGGLRLQVLRLRQVAQHARDRHHGDGAVHALAHGRGHRLRLLLRLPLWRDVAVGAEAGRELQCRSSRPTTRSTT